MTPATRHALGLVPLPDEQAARIEAQQRALQAGQYARWPAGLQHLHSLRLTPLPDVAELPEDSAWAQWDLAVKLGDTP
ncbi:MAG: hypothetical protein KAY54_04420 [Burkholderiaceae bacterium]|nr:hypothetical protein [Burkholderiaceae bacterium]